MLETPPNPSTQSRFATLFAPLARKITAFDQAKSFGSFYANRYIANPQTQTVDTLVQAGFDPQENLIYGNYRSINPEIESFSFTVSDQGDFSIKPFPIEAEPWATIMTPLRRQTYLTSRMLDRTPPLSSPIAFKYAAALEHALCNFGEGEELPQRTI